MNRVSGLDWRKAVAYPPECFPVTDVVDLQQGAAREVSYTVAEPYALLIHGLSLTRADAGLTMDVDGVRAVELADLRAARGLAREEPVRQLAWSTVQLRILPREAVQGYAWRHKVTVLKPSIALRIASGRPLAAAEEELAARLGLRDLLETGFPPTLPCDWGVEEVREVCTAAVGTPLSVTPREGRKAVLLGISATPVEPGAYATLLVHRDGVDIFEVDTRALPPLEEDMQVRVVALSRLTVTVTGGSGTVRLRLVYGTGRLTLLEKVMWGLKLTDAERLQAERLNLEERVRAGAL